MQLLKDTGFELGAVVDTCRKQAALDALDVLVRDDPSIEVPHLHQERETLALVHTSPLLQNSTSFQ